MGEIVTDFKLIYSYRVSNLKREEKWIRGKIFHEIIIELFEKYGEQLGYKDYHLFQGDIVRIKNLKHISPQYNDNIMEEIIFERKISTPKEGDGEVFLFHQIESLNLNPDSY